MSCHYRITTKSHMNSKDITLQLIESCSSEGKKYSHSLKLDTNQPINKYNHFMENKIVYMLRLMGANKLIKYLSKHDKVVIKIKG